MDARSKQLLVVDHLSRTYAELSLPLNLKTVNPFQAALDKEARKIMGFSLEGPVREVPGDGIVTYEGKIKFIGRTSDVSLSCRPVAAAEARPLLLLEAAAQQLNGGNEWISLLSSSQCLILSRKIVVYLPDIKLTTQEKLIKIEETDSTRLVLTPPEGYRPCRSGAYHPRATPTSRDSSSIQHQHEEPARRRSPTGPAISPPGLEKTLSAESLLAYAPRSFGP